MWKWFTKLLPAIGSVIPSPWFLFGALALIVGAYGLGSYRGDKSGYDRATVKLVAQCKIETDKKQAEINTLVEETNRKATELNARIADLEAVSAQDAITIARVTAERDKARGTIVTEYQTHYVEVAGKCGLSKPTIKAITDIMDVR